jgi:hypothetical protein
MDGKYLNRDIENILFNWVEDSIKNKSWKTFSDLHIDEIDNKFEDYSLWIDASCYFLEVLRKYFIEKNYYDYSIMFVIPLSCSDYQTNINDINLNYLKNNLDLTPPSIYIYPIGEKNYEETIKESKYLKGLFPNAEFKAYFKENEEGEEYDRTIYLINNPIVW